MSSSSSSSSSSGLDSESSGGFGSLFKNPSQLTIGSGKKRRHGMLDITSTTPKSPGRKKTKPTNLFGVEQRSSQGQGSGSQETGRGRPGADGDSDHDGNSGSGSSSDHPILGSSQRFASSHSGASQPDGRGGLRARGSVFSSKALEAITALEKNNKEIAKLKKVQESIAIDDDDNDDDNDDGAGGGNKGKDAKETDSPTSRRTKQLHLLLDTPSSSSASSEAEQEGGAGDDGQILIELRFSQEKCIKVKIAADAPVSKVVDFLVNQHNAVRGTVQLHIAGDSIDLKSTLSEEGIEDRCQIDVKAKFNSADSAHTAGSTAPPPSSVTSIKSKPATTTTTTTTTMTAQDLEVMKIEAIFTLSVVYPGASIPAVVKVKSGSTLEKLVIRMAEVLKTAQDKVVLKLRTTGQVLDPKEKVGGPVLPDNTELIASVLGK
jgi:hypothetical protein